jgi:hypothetical protein
MSNCNRDINSLKNELLKNRIELSDTLSQFMEKCNNNFSTIVEWGGGPIGAKGEDGDPGVPTKPKVPIHIWREDIEYDREVELTNDEHYINEWYADLSDVKYQEGHLIMLKNAHVYILELDGLNLKPKYIFGLQSYNPDDIVNGQNAYMHIAYANAPNSLDGFITDQQLRGETISTYNLRRDNKLNDQTISNKPYMGVYSDNSPVSSLEPNRYTWVLIQGAQGVQGVPGEKGIQGDKGEKGDKGDSYVGHPYSVDLEGDMGTISIGSIDRTRLYENDYCECTIHAYYGESNVILNLRDVTVGLPEIYSKTHKYLNDGTIVSISNQENKIGKIEKSPKGNDILIRFTPDEKFYFPKSTIIFPIYIKTSVTENNPQTELFFERSAAWMIKGITSSFELEIVPQHRIIKLSENGVYNPKKIFVDVYKLEDSERTLFDLSQNENFKLLYKNINDDNNNWKLYENGVDTNSVSCLEFKIVRFYGSTDPEKPEEIWDYEDVWVVADGKSSHYYHADLGNTESMMILTTGEKINIGTDNEEKYCAELRNESGYSITFNPKFYDGTEELEVSSISIGGNSGEEYYLDGTFERKLEGNKLTITKVPYGVDVIPMIFEVCGIAKIYDDNNEIKDIEIKDSISFNVYISTLSNIYTLLPTVTSYNTSIGKTGDTIGCDVFKNNQCISTEDLDENALTLKYVVHDGNGSKNAIKYTEPLIYGDDDDSIEDEFTASDVAIEFILYYRNKEVVRSTIPLIKDGIDGKDGDSWQYIFCRSPKYPFSETGISNPSEWVDDKPNDSSNELLGNNGIADGNWYSDHKGINNEYKYEYQSYRKWDKEKKCWGKYGEPTLYSNYSEDGSGYSVILSNPIATIPVGDDWSTNEKMSNQFDSTLVYLYNNTTDISKENVSISLPKPEDNIYVKNGNFEATKENGVNKIIFKPVVGDSIFNFGSDSQYKLPIVLTYDLGENTDNFETTINWTLSPIKGLNNVEVFVDKRVVNTSISHRHSLKVGYYIISSNDTKKFIEDDENGNTKKYQIIITDDIGDLQSGAISDWQNVEYDFVKDGQNRNCYVVLVDSDGKTIIDYVNVIAINDGKSAVHLELSKDYIALPCEPISGELHPEYNISEYPIHSQMLLYNGDTLIEDYDNIGYTFIINGKSVDGLSTDNMGGFDVPKELINGDTNIECIATYNNNSYHKTLFIDLEDTPYILELDKTILTRDINIGKIIDDSIIVRVKYWMNGKWEYTKNGVVKAKTTNGQNNMIFQGDNNTYYRILKISDSDLSNNTTDSEIRISYYKDEDSTDELSYEIIGIINNGKNGEKGKDGIAPSCVNVTILGYSLNIDNGTWVSSINELGTLETGQPIYILNEYTWSDGAITKGITVTLAGTQGSDGKSRVLFYLGSFEDGTLNGDSIEGLLTNDRCDYYISSNGTAWMRTGTSESATGYRGGPLYGDQNWKESTKVGFLQAGAIHAEMINVNSITAESALVTKLFAQEVEAKKLKVEAANIQGQLDAKQINTSKLTISASNITENSGTIPKTCIDASGIATDVITAAKGNIEEIITGHLKANKITADMIETSTLKIGVDNIDGDITTKIDGDGIVTKIIEADNADFKNLITNTIKSSNIIADNITVGKLNTTNGNKTKGTIDIEANEITVYDITAAVPILKVSGSQLNKPEIDSAGDDYKFSKSNHNTEGKYNIFSSSLLTLPMEDCETNHSGGNQSWTWSYAKQIGYFKTPEDGYSYCFRNNTIPYSFNLELQAHDDTLVGNQKDYYSIYIYCDFEFVKKGDEAPEKPSSISSLKCIYANYDLFLKLNKSNININEKINTPPIIVTGEYDIYMKYIVKIQRSYIKELPIMPTDLLQPDDLDISNGELVEVKDCLLKLNSQSINICVDKYGQQTSVEMIRNNNRCDISSYGFRYYANENKYAELTRYGTFIFRNGDNIFAVDDDGIGMTFDGDINNLQKVVPRKFKFRTDADEGDGYSNGYSWNKLTVLCLGDILETDGSNEE